MSSQHYYDIWNTKKLKFSLKSSNHHCFASFTNREGLKFLKKGGDIAYVYVVFEKMDLTEEEVKTYLFYLASLNITVTYEIINDFKRYKVAKDKPVGAENIKGKCYVFSLNFSDFTSKDHVKFGLHLLRHTFESTHYKKVRKTIELKDLFPDEPFIELFQFAYKITGDYGDGHDMMNADLRYEIVSEKIVLDNIREWAKLKIYEDDKIYELFCYRGQQIRNKQGFNFNPNKYTVKDYLKYKEDIQNFINA